MNIENILRNKFERVSKTTGRNGVEYKASCCFCGGKGKMYINPSHLGGVYNCYKCNKSGRLSDLIDWTSSSNFKLPPPQVEPLPNNVPMPGMMSKVNNLSNDNPGVQYLTTIRKRPFDLNELSELYNVQYCHTGTAYDKREFVYHTSNTLIFPVVMHNNVVGWQSRLLYDPKSLTDDECLAMGYRRDEEGTVIRPPKYWTSPGFRKGRVLYNFDRARQYPYVVVVEGVFDVFAVGPCAVATFGTGISDEQIALLKTYWSKVILLLDPDAKDKAVHFMNQLKGSVQVVAVNLGDLDAGDSSREAIWAKINEAIKESTNG